MHTVVRDVSVYTQNGNGRRAGTGELFRTGVVAGLPRAYIISKRVVDITLSAVGIAILLPIMTLIAAAVKLESRGPALFGHVRIGEDGRPFRCLKFRTMRNGAHRELHANGELRRIFADNDCKIPLDKDPRVTRVGRFLRKSSLDELPQLFNVLAGSMSLVGPRPVEVEELQWYGEDVDIFLSVKPGITGVWQVVGRSRIKHPERARLELDAIRNSTFRRDLWVLLKTIPVVILARGAL